MGMQSSPFECVIITCTHVLVRFIAAFNVHLYTTAGPDRIPGLIDQFFKQPKNCDLMARVPHPDLIGYRTAYIKLTDMKKMLIKQLRFLM